MSCIDADLIQKYIDEELTPEEVVMIENHLKQCKTCRTEVGNQQKLVAHVKNRLNLLAEEDFDIPVFKIPQLPKKKPTITSRRIIYSVAAACAVILLLIIFPKKEPVAENNEFFMQHGEYEYDANRTISEQELIIEIIDPEGNLTEYYLE